MGDGLQYPTQAQHQSPSYESMGETAAAARLDTSNTSKTNNIFDNNHINDADVVNVVDVNNRSSDSNFANVVVNVNNNDNNIESNLINCNNNATTTTPTTIPTAQNKLINDFDSNIAKITDLNKLQHEKDLHFIDEGFSSDEKLKNDNNDDDSVDGNSKLWAVKSNTSLIASAPVTPTITTTNHIIDI